LAKTFGRKQDPSAKTAAAEAAVSSVDDKPRRGTTSSKTPEQRLAEMTIPPHFLVPPLLYSPMQLNIATFLGGPLAGTYGLYKNAMALKEYEDGLLIICVGIFYTLAAIILFPYLKETVFGIYYQFFPVMTALLAQAGGAKQLENMMKKQGGGVTPEYEKQSWLTALGLGFISFVISLTAFLLARNFFSFIQG